MHLMDARHLIAAHQLFNPCCAVLCVLCPCCVRAVHAVAGSGFSEKCCLSPLWLRDCPIPGLCSCMSNRENALRRVFIAYLSSTRMQA